MRIIVCSDVRGRQFTIRLSGSSISSVSLRRSDQVGVLKVIFDVIRNYYIVVGVWVEFGIELLVVRYSEYLQCCYDQDRLGVFH